MILYRPVFGDTDVMRLFHQICKDLLVASPVNTGHWQAKKDTPMSDTRELLNVTLEFPITASGGSWAEWMRPNLPWAEDHFQERISGEPLNPPPSSSYWPFARKDNSDFKEQGVFSHSYPERLWPCRAGDIAEKQKREGFTPSEVDVNVGIRYRYGDLNDLVALLVREPYTRQAYVPMWFPEDLYAAAHAKERVPCSLGWHFILRNNKLHCFYPMRSLDLLRYARDDWYMTGRLCQWVIERCQKQGGENCVWHDITPGILTCHAVSLHIFEGDVPIIKRTLEKQHKKGVSL